MKRTLAALLILFSLSCERENDSFYPDGSWVGFVKISNAEFVVRFDINTEANAVFGNMYFYTDTMPIIEPSYFTQDSVIMYIDYVIVGADFHFNGKVRNDGNAAKGTYSINSVSGTRIEPFEIYRDIK